MLAKNGTLLIFFQVFIEFPRELTGETFGSPNELESNQNAIIFKTELSGTISTINIHKKLENIEIFADFS